MNFQRKTYNSGIKSFDYLIVPKSEYNYKLICEVHNLPFLLGEWQSFYSNRFYAVNGFSKMDIENQNVEFIKLPIITERECLDFGL